MHFVDKSEQCEKTVFHHPAGRWPMSLPHAHARAHTQGFDKHFLLLLNPLENRQEKVLYKLVRPANSTFSSHRKYSTVFMKQRARARARVCEFVEIARQNITRSAMRR